MSDRPQFDPPGHTFIGAAIAAIVADKKCDIYEGRAELRRQLASGEKRACLVHHKTGALLSVPAHQWNAESCMPWLHTGKAEITAAEWQVWRSPEQQPPLCFLYVVDPPSSQMAAAATGQPARRGRGKPGDKTKNIADQMRKMDRAALADMKQVEMEATFGASRDTCERARKMAMSENAVK